MTMILGLNLSDKIYLAADTRVTHDDGRHVDIIVKILPLVDGPSPKPVPLPNNIHVAVAGDVRLATFFYEEIYRRINSGNLSSNIRIFKNQLDDGLITHLLKDWVSHYSEPFGHGCSLLFGGQTSDGFKTLPRARLSLLLAEYEKSKEKYRLDQHKIVEALEKDPTMKMINEKMLAEAGKGVLESLEESFIPEVPQHIKEAMESSEGKSSQRDSLIFSLDIAIGQGGISISREEAEWGQLISRGAKGISSGDVPTELLATMELMPGKRKNQPHMLEGAFMSATILDMARERNASTIGGQVIISIIEDGWSKIGGSGNGVSLTPQGMRIKVTEEFRPAIPFNRYLSKGDSSRALL